MELIGYCNQICAATPTSMASPGLDPGENPSSPPSPSPIGEAQFCLCELVLPDPVFEAPRHAKR